MEADGYDTIRSAGSKGTWDVVAIGPTVRLVQIKANCEPSKEELEVMKEYRVPTGVSKELWVFKDRVRNPVIHFF